MRPDRTEVISDRVEFHRLAGQPANPPSAEEVLLEQPGCDGGRVIIDRNANQRTCPAFDMSHLAPFPADPPAHRG
jgi:hypothetical protein